MNVVNIIHGFHPMSLSLLTHEETFKIIAGTMSKIPTMDMNRESSNTPEKNKRQPINPAIKAINILRKYFPLPMLPLKENKENIDSDGLSYS